MLLRVVFSIISTDPDFVVDMTDLLRAAARHRSTLPPTSKKTWHCSGG